MTAILRITDPIYQINMWGNQPDGPVQDGPDVDGYERAYYTDVYPQTGKGYGSLKGFGTFGYASSDYLPVRGLYRPAIGGSYPLNSTGHVTRNILAPDFSGGTEFKIKVDPGQYYVVLSYGDINASVNDIYVNRVDFTTGDVVLPAGPPFPLVGNLVDASNGFISIVCGRNDSAAYASTILALVKVHPVIYYDETYPSLTNFDIDPASPANQAMVAKLVYRDLALCERPISMTFDAVNMTNARFNWQVVTAFNAYVPRYANKLILGLRAYTSISFPKTDPAFVVNLVANRGATEAINLAQATQNRLVSGSITGGAPAYYELEFDVRNLAGREVYLELVGYNDDRLDPGMTTVLLATDVFTTRFTFDPDYRVDDVSLLATGQVTASGTIV